jgi:plasmid stabilization system protein ParE
MARVLFHAAAEAEVDAAFEWYWKQSSKAASGFLNELARVVALIRRHPRQFSALTPTLRKANLNRYPYYLLFRHQERQIEVMVVAHAKREPGYWKGRE